MTEEQLMRRGSIHEDEGSEDSFLDVVANVVGVLIILVMLIGAQASRTVAVAESTEPTTDTTVPLASEEASQDVESLLSELESSTRAARTSQRILQATNLHISKLSYESQAYDRQRIELAMHHSLLEEDLERRKQQLDQQQQCEFDVQRQLLDSKIDLEQLSQEQLSLMSAPDTVTEVECVPTPLAKVVEGKSIHLRLSRGLVSVVPLEELLAETRHNLEDLRRRLQANGRVVEVFGPLDGYRLKLTVAKQTSSESVGGPLVGRTQRTNYSQYAEILPNAEEIGQNVEQALLPGGRLHQLLDARRRQKPAVVVWLYTDSFDEFRPLKRALWERGFSLATRPMRPGTRIGASPFGTRAAAQ